MRVNNALSNPLDLKHGVPQGSILGPLLFNVHINDLSTVCTKSNIGSYADDSQLYLTFSSKRVDLGVQDLTDDLLRVASWCWSNKLLIDPSKIKLCTFGTAQMLAQITIPSINFQGKCLTRVRVTPSRISALH